MIFMNFNKMDNLNSVKYEDKFKYYVACAL